MGSFKLWIFEVKKQLSSITFLAILLVVTVFAISQLTSIFHIPITSDKDIEALEQSGEHEYIFVDNTETELVALSLDYLNERIADGHISKDRLSEFESIIEMLESGTHSFDDVLDSVRDNDFLFPYLSACKSQFAQRLGTVEEVNSTMLSAFGSQGYTTELYQKYVTYMQIIAVLVIFPLFMFLFTRDYKSSMYEIVYMQPIKEHKYILSRYFGAFIPIVVYLYVFGVILNLISAIRFIGSGFSYEYTMFLPTFMLYIFPCVFFFSTLITVSMMIIKKAVAIFPLYIAFVILNVTPTMFYIEENTANILMPLIRLDEQIGSIEQILLNRLVYLVLGCVFLALTCRFYKKMKADLTKGVTI